MMREYTRENPLFSLCGLNCGLCPRFHTEGPSRCPGCGGNHFHLLHPSCAVIACSKKHGAVEYCFQCESYPCEKYRVPTEKDSFISYRNVLQDMKKAANRGTEAYTAELNEKIRLIKHLIAHCNDGRKKSFYCNAVNLMELADLDTLWGFMEDFDESISKIDRIKAIEAWFYEKAANKNTDLALRK